MRYIVAERFIIICTLTCIYIYTAVRAKNVVNAILEHIEFIYYTSYIPGYLVT